MNLFHDASPRMLVIAALVAAGFLYANAPDMNRWTLSCFHNACPDERPRGSNRDQDEDTTRKALPRMSVCQIDWSADGQKLLSLSHRAVEGFSSLNDIVLHNIAMNDVVQKTGHLPIDAMGDSISSAALAHDARHVLASSFEGRLWWIDLESFESILLVELTRPASLTAAAISDDGRLFAAADNTGSIYLCDSTGRSTTVVTHQRQSCLGELRFSRDAERLVGARNDGSVSVWNVVTGALLQDFVGHEMPAMAAAFLLDGKRIISVSLDDTVRIWDIAGGREEWHAEFGLWGITTLAVSTDGTTAAFGGFNGKIVVWDLVHARKKFEIVTPMSVIFDLKFSPAGTLLAAAGTEGTIYMYNLHTAAEERGIDVELPHSM